MELSKRLTIVASAVTPGNRVTDVGTDHGYVPIFLMQKNLCPQAIAMDINKGPLQRAKDHIREEGLAQKIATRLSDGMKELGKDETDTVVIAGMGGDLTCRILEARKDLLEDGLELVLQPQSEWFKVRHTLHEYHYKIVQEWFVKDEGKYYVVIKAVPGTQKFKEEYEYAYGAFVEEECEAVLQEYIHREITKRKEIIESLEKVEERSSEKTEKDEKNLCKREQRIQFLKNEIEQLKKRSRAGR